MPIADPTRQPEAKEPASAKRLFRGGVWLIALAIASLRFLYLSADFPNFSQWSLDQAKYTDEGWWASAAVMHHLLGHWYMPGDYNPAIAVPVWPALLGIFFHFTGVSILAARALSNILYLAALGIVYFLVRRYARPGSELAPGMAILLLAASPFAFVFSRLAILDTFVLFQFCLLLFVASRASIQRIAWLAVLVPAILLSKTTAAVLLPAVAWLAWSALRQRWKPAPALAALAAVAVVSALAIRAYLAIVAARGYGPDWKYFYDINQVEDIDWRQTLATVADLFHASLWVDRILYPAALVAVVLACARLRVLWRNPLFAACCIAFAGQAAYIFLRQGNYAPRYFLPMLVPVIVVVSLAMEEIKAQLPRIYIYCLVPIAVAFCFNLGTILFFLHHRTFQLYGAGNSIAAIVRADKAGNPMILGVSGSEISLLTGLPSINDVYGTDTLERKIARYRPGWYLAWNGIGPDERQLLSSYGSIEPVAAYPVFDDDERNRLILYRLTRPSQ